MLGGELKTKAGVAIRFAVKGFRAIKKPPTLSEAFRTKYDVVLELQLVLNSKGAWWCYIKRA